MDAPFFHKYTPQPMHPVSPSYIDPQIMQRSLTAYHKNPLYLYVKKLFGEESAHRLFLLYNVGTSSKWNGSTVYWQVDMEGRVHTGKVMRYDAQTGHRVKEPHGYVSWAHAELQLKDFHLQQCLFGEHLLSQSSSSRVILVESEKTAIIGKHFLPEYIWLATGGKNGCFNSSAVQCLKGRSVLLIPDLGATEDWKKKMDILLPICLDVKISDVLEEEATDEQRARGLDIADFLLMEETPGRILEKMKAKNPNLQLLIDTLGLELVEEQ